MDDLISRKAALDALLQCRKHCIDPFDSYHIDIEDAEARIRRVPAAQPEPIKLHFDHVLTEEEIKNLKQKIADLPIALMPSAQRKILK